MLWFHIVFLFKHSCDFTYNNKIILNQKNESYQFLHRYNNAVNSYFLLIAIAIAPLMAPFVTGYVNAHYPPCSNNKGIFPGAIYIKNGVECNNEYISHRDD